ncbi:MAG: sugar ABC transporter permease, partial [Oscillibacter sp.]|nr:sugar ABC transporter permease [Oscillibacter sp.]
MERRNYYGILFCLPFVIAFLVFNIYPVFRTFQMSFLNYKGFGKETFVGFDNYARAVQDPLFRDAFVNTLKMWGVNIVLQLGLALLLTIIFNDIKYRMKGLGIFRA